MAQEAGVCYKLTDPAAQLTCQCEAEATTQMKMLDDDDCVVTTCHYEDQKVEEDVVDVVVHVADNYMGDCEAASIVDDYVLIWEKDVCDNVASCYLGEKSVKDNQDTSNGNSFLLCEFDCGVPNVHCIVCQYIIDSMLQVLLITIPCSETFVTSRC